MKGMYLSLWECGDGDGGGQFKMGIECCEGAGEERRVFGGSTVNKFDIPFEEIVCVIEVVFA